MEVFEKSDKRTHYCGTLSAANIGERVCVLGWCQRQRDLGSLIFIDLRDRTGIIQLAFDENTDKDIFRLAFNTRSEFVLCAKGVVRHRGEGAVNENLPTGEIEVAVDGFKVLSEAQTPPFPIVENSDTNSEIRLTHRYLDLRRPDMQRNIMARSEISNIARNYFRENGFIDIETPCLIKPSPEGARDYLVPSRVHPGCFYALPQSPQLYKQLLMYSGFDRYIQIARCFRDEDLRADRQPEFTQIDLEMSFADEDDIISVNEGFIKRLFDEFMHQPLEVPFKRMTWHEAMERFGSDKPDTRFGMEIYSISDLVSDTEFAVFNQALEAGGSVRAITVKGGAAALTRKEIDKLTEYVRGIGAKGLMYIRYSEDKPNCSFAKFISEQTLADIIARAGAEKGDVVFIIADKNKVALPVLGALRLTVAKKLDMIPKDKFNFLWITQFPFFEYDDESGKYVAMHHPFTMPEDDCIQYLDSAPEKVIAKAYDLVLNGVEMSSGSIRITDYELQQRMFEALGLTDEEIEAKFGFLVEAYKYGAAPHGGMGIGLDRLAMVMTGADSLRDVTAFPKVQNASELMSDAPGSVDAEQLRELSISIIEN